MNKIVMINLICDDGSMIVLDVNNMRIIDRKVVETIQKNAVSGTNIEEVQEQLKEVFGADPS
ncbi:hypothetical protein [Leptospira interrogans]|uniref:Uncharacterized protein n=1 Tax=Leptospira interrogans serovar Pyrogenes str. L0374 TaxID=1049928 RepID=M6KSZ3_LEPIR|nr:hypothetical protein [Leptospira interrogans]EMN30922.1 hypothetical protein LEP1GSC083_2025 [Leptospira interrogans serovar Pyrogenes str. L0374]EMO96262.1 hypothetical protein LEP1GSC109_3260 [Leptospira interrogans str. UI 13372]